MDSDFDRKTALEVLKDISYRMHPCESYYVGKVLTISRSDFEEIRKKWLDKPVEKE